MARAQQKTSVVERAALSTNAQTTGHIDYRGMTSKEIRDAWIFKFESGTDHALARHNLERVDRHWRRAANTAMKPGGKY